MPVLSFSQSQSVSDKIIIWKANYYGAIPNQPGINQAYCDAHEPGVFIGNVQDELAHGAQTNHQIFLDQFTFQEQKINGLYFMQGSLQATGKYLGKPWQDKISYYVYKLTEEGQTQGVWSSGTCKGWYLGVKG